MPGLTLPRHRAQIPMRNRSHPHTNSYSLRVKAEPGAVSDARRTIIGLVRGWDVPLSPDAIDDLALLCSELITNAIRHTRAPCAVDVRWTGVRVRVEVTDTNPVRPHPRVSPPDSEGGRGLLLVESVATAWGTKADPAGKVVWCEVGPPDSVARVRTRRLLARVRAVLPFDSPTWRPVHPRRRRWSAKSAAAKRPER